MQTFVPFADLQKSASVLDRQRLGKQRVETYQLLRVNTGLVNGWYNHPAAKMWRHNVPGLIAYGVAICNEWLDRGYKDTCLEKILSFGEPDFSDLPYWWGVEEVHSSHRSSLLFKNPEYYSQFGWTEAPTYGYIWPPEFAEA